MKHFRRISTRHLIESLRILSERSHAVRIHSTATNSLPHIYNCGYLLLFAVWLCPCANQHSFHTIVANTHTHAYIHFHTRENRDTMYRVSHQNRFSQPFLLLYRTNVGHSAFWDPFHINFMVFVYVRMTLINIPWYNTVKFWLYGVHSKWSRANYYIFVVDTLQQKN